MKKCILIVIDSLGCGDAPDAEEYNKIGSNTISNVSYEVNGLDFTKYQVKIVFVSQNQALCPIIRDMRAIALAV